MSDYITHKKYTGFSDYSFGIGEIRDNHGNSASGRNIQCSTGDRYHQSISEYLRTSLAFNPYVIIDRVPDGITRLGNMESPLKTFCDQRETGQRSSQTPSRPAH